MNQDSKNHFTVWFRAQEKAEAERKDRLNSFRQGSKKPIPAWKASR